MPEPSKPWRTSWKNRTPKDRTAKKSQLGDTTTMKRLLDDAVISVLLEKNEGHQYVEDTSMSNLKLVIGFAGVGSSAVSHAYPATFPKNWWVLLACCAWYFAMSGILQLLLSFVELESILIVRGKARADGTKQQNLNVSTYMPRYQEMFTLGITPVPGGALSLMSAPSFRPTVPGGNTAPGCLQREWSVAEYFDEDGDFDEEKFMEQVHDFIDDYNNLYDVVALKKE